MFSLADKKVLVVGLGRFGGGVGVAKWLVRARDLGIAQLSAPDPVAAAMLAAIQHHAFTTYIVNKSFSTRSSREFLDDLAAFFARALAPERPVRKSVSPRTRKSK